MYVAEKAVGDMPYKRLKVRLKLLLSEKPQRSTISPTDRVVVANNFLASAIRHERR